MRQRGRGKERRETETETETERSRERKDLCEQDLGAGVLVVPAELVNGRAPSLIIREVFQELGLLGRLVQPCRGPQQLILKAGVGAVERAGSLIGASVLVGEVE